MIHACQTRSNRGSLYEFFLKNFCVSALPVSGLPWAREITIHTILMNAKSANSMRTEAGSRMNPPIFEILFGSKRPLSLICGLDLSQNLADIHETEVSPSTAHHEVLSVQRVAGVELLFRIFNLDVVQIRSAVFDGSSS